MATAVETPQPDSLLIRPPSRWAGLGIRDLWRYRELLFFLTWRDVKVRYKQTVLGAFWALLQPFVTMIVFTVVFNHIGRIKTGPVPYPLFALSGLALWFYFANAVNMTANSLVSNSALITKVFFPRLIVAITPVLAGLIDLALALVIVAGAMAYYGFVPELQILLVPVFMLLMLVTALAVGLFLAALNVRYRDIRYAVPFVMQIWLYVSPIAYSSDQVPARFRTLYGVNPLSGVIDGFRWSLLGTGHLELRRLAVSTAVTLVLLFAGAAYFSRTERTFADVI
jgi:lipopolysaccharide transport system permease protein